MNHTLPGLSRLKLSVLLLPMLAAAGCPSARPKGPPIFIPPPPAPARLQVLIAFSTERQLGGRSKLSSALLGKKQTTGNQLVKPYGAAMRAGLIYVTDTVANAVWVVNIAAGKITPLVGDQGMGKLRKPINVAFDAVGNLYVTDTGRGQVVVFDSEQRYARSITIKDLRKPSGLAIVGDQLIVSDTKSHQIFVLDRNTGKELRRFGGPGLKPGQTSFPSNVAVDADRNIYVSETLTGRVQKFSPEGKLLKQFGTLGRRMGEFIRPKGVAVDDKGNVYVSDAATNQVQIFDKEGRLLLFFGGSGRTPGSIYVAAGVTVTSDQSNLEAMQELIDDSFAAERLIIVVSQYGNMKLTVLALGRRRGEPESPPPTPPPSEAAPVKKPDEKSK